MTDQRWIVVADSPFLPASGGGEREHLGFVRAAARARWLTALVVPSREPLDLAAYRRETSGAPVLVVPRRTSPLRLLHPRYPYVVASRPAPRDLAARVQRAAGSATGVVIFSYKSHRLGRALAAGLGVPAVLRQHNREAAYHRSLADALSGPRRLVTRWEAARIAHDEAALDRAGWLSAIADISLADARARQAAGARNVLFVPPFALDAALLQRPLHERVDAPRVLFLGALDVPTNVSALTWFLSSVWPAVREAVPGAALDVVGRGPSAHVRALTAAPGVDLHADVPSVLPFLDRAAVAVNPAVSGSGVNIKVVDYLQAGVPVVSTSFATSGLPLLPGIDLAVADTAHAFATEVVALLTDPVRRARLAASGRGRVQELLDPSANLARLAEAFDRAAPEAA